MKIESRPSGKDIDPPDFWRIDAWQPVESPSAVSLSAVSSRPNCSEPNGLQVERLARELTQKVYRLTKKPGFAKDYGLKRQTRLPDGGQVQDAAGSSMHNIAEGFDSETNAEFIRFLRYAKWSCKEVQTCLPPARRLAGGYQERKVANPDFIGKR